MVLTEVRLCDNTCPAGGFTIGPPPEATLFWLEGEFVSVHKPKLDGTHYFGACKMPNGIRLSGKFLISWAPLPLRGEKWSGEWRSTGYVDVIRGPDGWSFPRKRTHP